MQISLNGEVTEPVNVLKKLLVISVISTLSWISEQQTIKIDTRSTLMGCIVEHKQESEAAKFIDYL